MIVSLFINQAILFLGQCTRLGTWKGMPLKGVWWEYGWQVDTGFYGEPGTGTLTRPKPWTQLSPWPQNQPTNKPTNQPTNQLELLHKKYTVVYKGNRFKDTGTFDTKVYFKPTDTLELLHKKSHHPNHTFKGLIKSQILRYVRICNNKQDIVIIALIRRDYLDYYTRNHIDTLELLHKKSHRFFGTVTQEITSILWNGYTINHINTLELLHKKSHHLNHPSITVRAELSSESMHFLDTVAYKGNRFKETGTFDTKVYFKPTDTLELLQNKSHHPNHTFEG